MKHYQLALSIAALAVSAATQAQSVDPSQPVVTVFGVADLSVRNVRNGDGTATSLASGGMAASRLGVRVEKNIGDGLTAGGWAEGTVNFDDGTTNSSRLFNRRSTVSLSGPFGEVRAGHDLTTAYTAFGEFDVFGTSGLADQGKFYSSADAVLGSGLDVTGVWARADNALAYYTPNSLGGFYAQLQAAPSEGVSAKEYLGTRLGYKNGPVHVTAAYSTTVGTAGDFKRRTVSGSYDFTTFKVLGSLTKNEYLTASRQIAQLGVTVPVFEKGLLRIAYTGVDASGTSGATSIDNNDVNQVAVGYVHTLVKGCNLYGTYTQVDNGGRAAFAVSTPPAAVAGRISSGVEFGVSLSF